MSEMPVSTAPLYDAAGEHAGWRRYFSDGSVLDSDLEDNAVQVYESDPEPEADDGSNEYYDEPEADPLTSIDARLAALENYAEQPVDYSYAPEDEVDMNAVAASVDAQMAREEARRGAVFTRQDQVGILERARDAIAAGQMPDIPDILEQMRDEGQGVPDLDTRQGRQDFMVGRLQDAEAEEEGVELGEARPPSQPEYDLTRRDDRAILAADKLEGRDVDQAYIHDGDDFVGGYTGAYTIDPGDE